MKAEIEKQLARNLARVESLMETYETTVSARAGGGVQGRVAVVTADLLRAAVVFLHATLEDLLRVSLDWRLPLADPPHLAQVPLVGCKKSRGGHEPCCDLSDLAQHRGKSIDVLLRESVTEHLKNSNYNHPGDLDRALKALSVPTTILDPHKDALGAMMARRHWIVHRADRNDLPGRGHYEARSLDPTTVRRWRDAVRGFGEALTAALP